jgi:hypothetical protein
MQYSNICVLLQIKLKIQNDRMNPVPDMLLDWDKLSETELKRLVSQLEKTRNDLRYSKEGSTKKECKGYTEG